MHFCSFNIESLCHVYNVIVIILLQMICRVPGDSNNNDDNIPETRSESDNIINISSDHSWSHWWSAVDNNLSLSSDWRIIIIIRSDHSERGVGAQHIMWGQCRECGAELVPAQHSPGDPDQVPPVKSVVSGHLSPGDQWCWSVSVLGSHHRSSDHDQTGAETDSGDQTWSVSSGTIPVQVRRETNLHCNQVSKHLFIITKLWNHIFQV